jgi:hypothetical protein
MTMTITRMLHMIPTTSRSRRPLASLDQSPCQDPRPGPIELQSVTREVCKDKRLLMFQPKHRNEVRFYKALSEQEEERQRLRPNRWDLLQGVYLQWIEGVRRKHRAVRLKHRALVPVIVSVVYLHYLLLFNLMLDNFFNSLFLSLS